MATESSSGETTAEQQIVQEVLRHLRAYKRYPTLEELRGALPDQSAVLDTLLKRGFLRVVSGYRVLPMLAGFLKYGAEEAKVQVERFLRLLPSLERASRKELKKTLSVQEIASLTGEPPSEVSFTLSLFAPHLPFAEAINVEGESNWVSAISFPPEGVDPEQNTRLLWQFDEEEGVGPSARLSQLRVSGYRALERFDAQLESLTVIIGANAAGKSSLFDLLAFISFAAVNPLPPELDPRSVGKTLFHVGGPESIELALQVVREAARPLRYHVKLSGPVGQPRVVSERLGSLRTDSEGRTSEVFTFLNFESGQGNLRSVLQVRFGLPQAPPWTLPRNELALRRALDPTFITLNEFREYVSGWKFYAGFDVGMTAAIRRPVFTEPEPVLKEDGSNLSAVLFHLKAEHPDNWSELETHLRSAVPSFLSLNVKPRGGPGTVMAVWREQGLKGELTLADLSDGTLKFLCWATLCLSPRKPPLVCIDEPELGLHPRVLPVLAGLLRQAATETQLLVTTHSPYFLSQFSLEEIAVMKKVEGRAVFARPASNEALRQEIEELGSGELIRLHISDELEARS
ncbi:MAG TPA: AAA family ATPase [Archangium sp.]|jgi:predicted ATPase|uniref:AAA family ATPase n=1 Tax=Archangium sp. TaxID=1872627 RepID=UPI002ED7C06A